MEHFARHTGINTVVSINGQFYMKNAQMAAAIYEQKQLKIPYVDRKNNAGIMSTKPSWFTMKTQSLRQATGDHLINIYFPRQKSEPHLGSAKISIKHVMQSF